MNNARACLLCLITSMVVMAGCHRTAEVQLKREGTPGEIIGQFTNLLASGSTPDRIGAVSALATLARESWDQASTETAVTALMRATHTPDTNVQTAALQALSNWSASPGAISNAAFHELSNSEGQTRCAAATLLLNQNIQNQDAASTLLSLLEHPESSVRSRAWQTLTLQRLVRSDLLEEQLRSRLQVLANATNQDIRVDAIGWYWEINLRESTFSAARLDSEAALLKLLNSENAQLRRKVTSPLLSSRFSSGIGFTEVASLPLQDFIKNGLGDSDLYLAVTMAHLINELNGHNSPPEPGTLDALKRGLEDPDPVVRLAALSPMSPGRSSWWKISHGFKKETNSPYVTEQTSANPMILQPLTNALHDPDWNVRQAAATTIFWGLTDLRESLAPALWQVAIDELNSPDPSKRLAALRMAAGWQEAPQRFIEQLQIALKDADWRVRRAALNAVAYSSRPGGGFRFDLKVWSPLCDDPAPGVRAFSGELLLRAAAWQGQGTNVSWPTIPTVVQRLVEDPYPHVSMTGLAVLRQISAATNKTSAVLEARTRLYQIATGTNVSLKVRLARCYAQTYGRARPPDAETNLLILAAAPESIVRRHAVAALKFLGLAIPPATMSDPDSGVRMVATNYVQPNSSASLSASDSLESLLQKMKAADPDTRRKAAVALGRNNGVPPKSGVSAEAVKVLLETYTNTPPTEFGDINSALSSLVNGPDYARLWPQVRTFAIQMVLSDDPAIQIGAWGLLVSFAPASEIPDQSLVPITGVVIRRAQDPKGSIRSQAVRLLPAFDDALTRRSSTNTVVAFQVRKSLVAALGDRESEVAISAATPFVEKLYAQNAILDHIPLSAELSEQAAAAMETRLADPQAEVRQIMALALLSLSARKSDTNRVQKALGCLEELFTRPERAMFFLANVNNIPSGFHTLVTVAFRSTDPIIRQLTGQKLARSLEMVDESERSTSWFKGTADYIASYPRDWQPKASEFEPLINSLLKIANDTNTVRAEAAGRLLGRFRPTGDNLPAELMTRAHSRIAAERRLAMLELANENQSPSEDFREKARRLACELTDDPDASVRKAALQAFSSNLFPRQPSRSQTPFAIEPLIKALDDASPEVQKTTFYILAANLQMLPESNLGPLALPLLKRMMTKSDGGYLPRFGDLASHVKDQTMRERILLDIQDQIDRADNDDARSNWVTAIGRLHLAFDQPNEAAASFQKALRLRPNDQNLFQDLDKALRLAGRDQEADLGPAPRPNWFEVISELQALAKETNVARLARVATRALDGYLPSYGGRTPTGWGEPDQVIAETGQHLLALQNLDALEEFLKGALKRYPESPAVPVGQAKLCSAQNRKEEAIALLERELKQHDWNDTALQLFRTLCKETNQKDRYETVLRGLVETHPDQEMFCRPMVELYVRSGRTNEARNVIAAFRTATESKSRDSGIQDFSKNPQYPWHQSTLSDLLELMGDLDAAIAARIEANKTMPTNMLASGQQRLEALYKRAGITKAPAGATSSPTP